MHQQNTNIDEEEIDHAFNTVLNTFARLNSRTFFQTCHDNYQKVGRGCLYLHYNSYHSMLHSDEHRIRYIDQTTLNTQFDYDLVKTNVVNYDPELSYVFLVGCDVSEQQTMFKSAVVMCVDRTTMKCEFCGSTGTMKRCTKCKSTY
jgi:hypothetical protein